MEPEHVLGVTGYDSAFQNMLRTIIFRYNFPNTFKVRHKLARAHQRVFTS